MYTADPDPNPDPKYYEDMYTADPDPSYEIRSGSGSNGFPLPYTTLSMMVREMGDLFRVMGG
jgi:hypothetical protein